MSKIQLARKEIKKNADPKRAKINAWFFKTGKGEYGEGDRFIGLTVPVQRAIARKFSNLSLVDIKKLLSSKIHEERAIALLILVLQFEKGEEKIKRKICDFYLKNTRHINNWDLVDTSAHKIVGAYVLSRKKDILYTLARSKNLWERRIAMISTYTFIQEGRFYEATKIAKMLLSDTHDLIHKASGWMLREVGKKDVSVLEQFLKKHYKTMPRTMLRYAIERFPETKRKRYLKGLV